jgi:hypothetical protein
MPRLVRGTLYGAALDRVPRTSRGMTVRAKEMTVKAQGMTVKAQGMTMRVTP